MYLFIPLLPHWRSPRRAAGAYVVWDEGVVQPPRRTPPGPPVNLHLYTSPSSNFPPSSTGQFSTFSQVGHVLSCSENKMRNVLYQACTCLCGHAHTHMHMRIYITQLSNHNKHSWSVLEHNWQVWTSLHRLKMKKDKYLYLKYQDVCITLCPHARNPFYIMVYYIYTFKTIGSVVHIRDELDGPDLPSPPIQVSQGTETVIPPVASALLGPELKKRRQNMECES